MTVTIARVSGASNVVSNKKSKVRTLTFSSTYATGGETITAADVNLKKIEQVIPHGNLAVSTDLATANPIGFTIASDGRTVAVTQYEGAASGAALAEKTNSEAYATGSNIRVTFIGY